MQRKGGSDLRNRELDVMNEIDIIESKKNPQVAERCVLLTEWAH